MNIDAYLGRIRYQGSRAPTLNTLRALHRAHLLATPFENLSIFEGENVRLEHSWLYDKIVIRKRGGFCYELNGLFAWLLAELGFDVTLLSARVYNETQEEFGPEFDHLVLLVQLEKRWLVDVGFGEGFREPLQINRRGAQTQRWGAYRLDERGDETLCQRREGEGWKPQYSFSLAPRKFADFKKMCHYHQTSPRSSFTQKQLCTLATPQGRVTLSGTRLIETVDGQRTERNLVGEEVMAMVQEAYFGLPASRLAAPGKKRRKRRRR